MLKHRGSHVEGRHFVLKYWEIWRCCFSLKNMDSRRLMSYNGEIIYVGDAIILSAYLIDEKFSPNTFISAVLLIHASFVNVRDINYVLFKK